MKPDEALVMGRIIMNRLLGPFGISVVVTIEDRNLDFKFDLQNTYHFQLKCRIEELYRMYEDGYRDWLHFSAREVIQRFLTLIYRETGCDSYKLEKSDEGSGSVR